MLDVVFITVAILIAQASTQSNVTCYTDLTCHDGGGGVVVSSAEECCVGGDGLAFQGGGNQPCQECVVFGWTMMGGGRDRFEGIERADMYFFRLGFIKGSRFNATDLQIVVTDTPLTARINDYIFNHVILTISQPLTDLGVEVLLVEDGIAMEPRETFQLHLFAPPIPTIGTLLLENEFLADTLEVIIRDSDRVSFQFSSTSYSAMEGSDLPIVIQRYGRIATNVTLRVDTMNLTALDSAGPHPIPPDVPPFDPLQPNIASSYPASTRDFKRTTIEVTFEPDGQPNSTVEINIPTNEDDVNEANQYFVVLLEVMQATDRNRVDLSARNISTCMIEDDDSVQISFTKRNYTVDEADSNPNNVSLERSRPSEQTLTVRIRGGSSCKNQQTAKPNGMDYSVNDVLFFTPEMMNAVVPISINDDILWENVEYFTVCFMRASTSAHFTAGSENERNAEVNIVSNDDVTVEFAETEYTALASEGAIDVMVMTSGGVVSQEPCIQLDLQTDIPGAMPYLVTICDMNTISVEINFTIALDNDQFPKTFQVELTLNDNSSPRPEMADGVVISPSRATIIVTESLSVSSSASSSFGVPLVAWVVPMCVVLLLLLLLVIVGGVCILRQRQRRKKVQLEEIQSEQPYWIATNGEGFGMQNDSSHNYTELMSLQLIPKRMSIASRQLKLMDAIGEGEFGMVYKAHLKCQSGSGMEQVAVKTLKGIFTPNDVRNMLKEVEKMQDLDHKNVMSLKGVCLDGGSGPVIVMPYMARGSLLDYLRKERKKLVVPAVVDKDKKLLLDMCLQIAKGMQYLAVQKIVHRDLAARNCMIDADGVIKVSDFGLSEDVYTQNYYRQDKGQQEVKLPVRWMAPESIEDWVFTEKSDVWSYGVTAWEIYTGGTVPYGGIRPMVILQLLKNGDRLPKPTNAACDDEIYSVMLDCWKENPKERPDFSELVITIATLLEAIAGYLSLSVSQCSDGSSESNESVRIEIEDNS